MSLPNKTYVMHKLVTTKKEFSGVPVWDVSGKVFVGKAQANEVFFIVDTLFFGDDEFCHIVGHRFSGIIGKEFLRVVL